MDEKFNPECTLRPPEEAWFDSMGKTAEQIAAGKINEANYWSIGSGCDSTYRHYNVVVRYEKVGTRLAPKQHYMDLESIKEKKAYHRTPGSHDNSNCEFTKASICVKYQSKYEPPKFLLPLSSATACNPWRSILVPESRRTWRAIKEEEITQADVEALEKLPNCGIWLCDIAYCVFANQQEAAFFSAAWLKGLQCRLCMIGAECPCRTWESGRWLHTFAMGGAPEARA